MKKRIISIITIMAMVVSMIVPTFAGNGDNTGDDIFGMSMYINLDEEGSYTLGDAFSFTVTAYVADLYKKTATKKIEITGPAEVSNFLYKDDNGQWSDISGFNVEETIYNEVDRELQVVFTEAGTYKITFSYITSEGSSSVSKYITVTDTSFSTSDEEPTTEPSSEDPSDETTTPDESSSNEPSSETTTPDESSSDEPSSETTTPEESSSDEPSSDNNETTTPSEVETTTTEEPATTVAPTTTKKITVKKTKVKKATKKKTSKKIKILLKKIKGANKYQVQISKKKKFSKKNILVKKTVKKVNFTIKNKKLVNKKKLWARARAIKVVNGKTYKGKWSKVKRVKISK